MPTAFTRFNRRYEVFEVSKSGDLRRTSVTLGEVLQDFGVHTRDVLSLGIQDERYNPPPAVLPRRGVIVIALGSFKALVHTEACLLFEAGKMDVSHIAPVLAELMRVNAQTRLMPSTAVLACHRSPKNPSWSLIKGSKGEPLSGSTEGVTGAGLEKGNEKNAKARHPSREDLCELGNEGILHPRGARGGSANGAPSSSSPTTATSNAPVMPNDNLRMKSDKDDRNQNDQDGAPDDGRSTGLVSKIDEYGEPDEKAEDDVREHQMKVMFEEQRPMPFELAMLEAMLQEVIESYYRRAHVVRRLMEQRLTASDITSVFTPNRVEHYRVIPLKLALRQLELKLTQTRACLEELLLSDEDMLGLLLTEAKELAQDELLDPIRHSVVELMLENYHRQLVLVEHDTPHPAVLLLQFQELAGISLDVSRNSMIEVDIRLSMLNLVVASSACVFGAMGMNVVTGLEESPFAFYALLGGTAAACAAGFAGVGKHLRQATRCLRSVARSGDSQQGKLMALNSICDHVDDIEIVLRTELESGGNNGTDDVGNGLINRDAMGQKLARVRGKEVSNEELDLIFAAFDTTGDGEIDTKEYGKLLTQSAASLTSHSGGNSNPKSPP
ncbi:unnamed protein product [Ascophyllum nodosum]